MYGNTIYRHQGEFNIIIKLAFSAILIERKKSKKDLETEPAHKFQILIATEEYEKDQQKNGLACHLVFTYTPTYPDEAPLVEIDESVNFDDGYEKRLDGTHRKIYRTYIHSKPYEN